MNASGIGGFASASPNQRRVNPVGGQAMKLLSLKAWIADDDERQVQEAEDRQVATRSADAHPA